MDLGLGGREKQSCGRDSCPRAIQQVRSVAHAHSDLVVPTAPLAGSSYRPSYVTQSKLPPPLPTAPRQPRRSWDLSLGLPDFAAGQPRTTLPRTTPVTRATHTCGLAGWPRSSSPLRSSCAIPERPFLPLPLSLIHLPDPSLASPHSSYLDLPRAVDVGRVVGRVVGAAKCSAGIIQVASTA